MSFGEDIEKARERLQTALGDKFNEYYYHYFPI
jgi:hypothetical protein